MLIFYTFQGMETNCALTDFEALKSIIGNVVRLLCAMRVFRGTRKWLYTLIYMVGPVGLEPTTNGL